MKSCYKIMKMRSTSSYIYECKFKLIVKYLILLSIDLCNALMLNEFIIFKIL